MIYLAFKFGQLRISAKPEFKTPLGLQCYSVREWGLDCCFGVFQSLFIISPPMAEGGTAEAAKKL
jgi:hypothetical protein